MKDLVNVLAVAALAPLAGAFVIPNSEIEAQLEPVGDTTVDVGTETPRTWLEAIVAERAAIDDSIIDDSIDDSWGPLSLSHLSSLGEEALSSLEDTASSILDTTLDAYSEYARRLPPTENLTIWEILEKSEHATTFASLVKEYDDLVQMLNTTTADGSGNHTVFIPADSAFDKIPKDHEKPSREELEDFLRNHIVPGNVPAREMWHRNTLPTLLKEKKLGDEPQRLRIRFGLRGVNINVHSRVLFGDVPAKNGVIHVLETVITRPAFVGKTLAANPPAFSTLLYAYAKTGFLRDLHGMHMEGSTMFAPSNDAFARLGHAVTGYLFNDERGLRILTAVLKYGLVANTTFYTDAVYGKLGEDVEVEGGRSTHYELKTLYDGKGLGVDVWRWGGWTSVKVNGHVGVSFADGVAMNGVIHVVDRVPLPPCPRGGSDEEITIEGLEERFRGLFGEEEEGEEKQVGFEDL